MAIEIAAFVTALGHATNIAKTAIQARDESKRREALTELMGALADLQAKHLAVIQNDLVLLEQNEALRKQLAAYDDWEQQKTRYTLENVGNGTLVRAFHPSEKSQEPPHWICANCYDQRQKSLLQRTRSINNYKCPRCGTEIFPSKVCPSA